MFRTIICTAAALPPLPTITYMCVLLPLLPKQLHCARARAAKLPGRVGEAAVFGCSPREGKVAPSRLRRDAAEGGF